MVHVIKTLTGVNISTQSDRISEDPEHGMIKITIPTLNVNDEFIENLKLPKDVLRNIYNSFVTLWGRSKADQVVGASEANKAVLLEESFKKNIRYIIGTDCPFFGKMLYLHMSGGFDKSRINLTTWV